MKFSVYFLPLLTKIPAVDGKFNLNVKVCFSDVIELALVLRAENPIKKLPFLNVRYVKRLINPQNAAIFLEPNFFLAFFFAPRSTPTENFSFFPFYVISIFTHNAKKFLFFCTNPNFTFCAFPRKFLTEQILVNELEKFFR